MKISPLLFPIGLGLSAGAMLGWIQSAPIALPGEPANSIKDARFEAARIQTHAFSNDARIIRLFSAILQPVDLLRNFEYAEAIGDLTAADLPALIKHVEDLPQNSRDQLLPILIERWFELDAKAAGAWAHAHPDFENLAAWVRADPEAAIKEAFSAPQLFRSPGMVVKALAQLVGADYGARIAKLKTLPDNELRSVVLSATLIDWAKTKPAAAYASLGELAAGANRDETQKYILSIWAESNPGAALREINAILPTLEAGVLGNGMVSIVTNQAASKDLRQALDWISGLPVEFKMNPGIAAAGTWARTEPIAALDWCLENGVDIARELRVSFIRSWPGVLTNALSANPVAVTVWLENLPPGSNRDSLMERGLQQSLWRIPADQRFEKEAVSMRLFGQLTEEAQILSASALGKKRGEQGLSDLNEWAQTFSPGQVRANAVAGAMMGVYKQGAEVDALLGGVSTGPDRDAALRGLASAMDAIEPASAASRALAIGDNELRRETLSAVITGWLKRDPEASRAWLGKDTLIPAAWKAGWIQ